MRGVFIILLFLSSAALGAEGNISAYVCNACTAEMTQSDSGRVTTQVGTGDTPVALDCGYTDVFGTTYLCNF